MRCRCNRENPSQHSDDSSMYQHYLKSDGAQTLNTYGIPKSCNMQKNTRR
eukprot:m.740818 g.740818  ORF g.740818 m.740818 type:complete len:50 (-) comp23116_c3_seq23:601-750(-)